MLLCLDYKLAALMLPAKVKPRIWTGSLAHVRGNEETLLNDFIIIINNKTKNKVSNIIIWASHDSRIFYSGLTIKSDAYTIFFYLCQWFWYLASFSTDFSVLVSILNNLESWLAFGWFLSSKTKWLCTLQNSYQMELFIGSEYFFYYYLI